MDGETMVKAARKVQLDQEAFKACTAAHKYKADVESNSLEGQRLGISGTPGFFINGIFLGGALPMATFERLIDAELEAFRTRAGR